VEILVNYDAIADAGCSQPRLCKNASASGSFNIAENFAFV
jgi:hypothetical protein